MRWQIASDRNRSDTLQLFWEVLNGVGVDGVGGKFPFFSFFVAFPRFSSFFFFGSLRFSPFSPRTRANSCNLLANREFHSDPICTDPVQNFPIIPQERAVFGVRSPFDRDRNCRASRSLSECSLQLHANITTDHAIGVLDRDRGIRCTKARGRRKILRTENHTPSPSVTSNGSALHSNFPRGNAQVHLQARRGLCGPTHMLSMLRFTSSPRLLGLPENNNQLTQHKL